MGFLRLLDGPIDTLEGRYNKELGDLSSNAEHRPTLHWKVSPDVLDLVDVVCCWTGFDLDYYFDCRIGRHHLLRHLDFRGRHGFPDLLGPCPLSRLQPEDCRKTMALSKKGVALLPPPPPDGV